MKKLLAATFVALLMVGCGGGDSGSDSPESNQSSAENPPAAKTAEVAKIDLDDNETLAKIITEAIDFNKLQNRGEKGEELLYAPNEQTPYTGWLKVMYGNGQINVLGQLKDGKEHGLWTWWYENGQKRSEHTYKDGKIVSATAWKPNGEKCPDTNLVDGNGIVCSYHKNGQKNKERTYKDGEEISTKEWDEDGNPK